MPANPFDVPPPALRSANSPSDEPPVLPPPKVLPNDPDPAPGEASQAAIEHAARELATNTVAPLAITVAEIAVEQPSVGLVDPLSDPTTAAAVLEEAAAMPAVAEQVAEQPASPGIPLMITAEQRERLRALGHSDDEIHDMTPAEAHRLLGLAEGEV